MIDVGMGEQYGSYASRVEVERGIVAVIELGIALEHAAVDEDFGVLGFEKIARAGDGLGSAKKGQMHNTTLLLVLGMLVKLISYLDRLFPGYTFQFYEQIPVQSNTDIRAERFFFGGMGVQGEA